MDIDNILYIKSRCFIKIKSILSNIDTLSRNLSSISISIFESNYSGFIGKDTMLHQALVAAMDASQNSPLFSESGNRNSR